MALLKPTPQSERTSTLNASKQLPRNRYAIRCIEEKFAPNNNGNPMVTLGFEIVSPETIVSPFTGETLEIAGAKLKPQYATTGIKGDDGKFLMKDTQEAVNRYADFRTRCGLTNPDEGIDYENPPLGFKGLVFDAILDSEEFVQRATPTPEQRAASQPGTPILGVDNKEMKSHKPFISQILGPSNVDVSNNPMLS